VTMEQFDQLLTCAICLDRYRNPKLLPCQHSFCMEPCLEGLVDYVRRQVMFLFFFFIRRFPFHIPHSLLYKHSHFLHIPSTAYTYCSQAMNTYEHQINSNPTPEDTFTIQVYTSMRCIKSSGSYYIYKNNVYIVLHRMPLENNS